MISRQTTKIVTLIAIVVIAGFFIYKGTAGTMKIITTGSSTVKVNMPDTNRLTSGLVGYWTFDGQDTNWTSATAGTTADKSPGGTNTGTLTNMSRTTSPVPGKIGQGFNFDGANDYISMTGQNLTGPMTISAWIYSKTSSDQGIVSKFASKSICEPELEPGSPYEFGINSSNKLFHYHDPDSGFCLQGATETSTDSISLNQWQHVVLARSSSQVTFYINGVQDSGGWQNYSGIGSNDQFILIGSREVQPLFFFNGYIDEVRIYNRALSASEITELYQQGQAKINASQAGMLTSGLVGHWTFDGQDTNWGTNTTNDRSGNNNNGTITNMSTTTSPVPGINGQAMYFDGNNDYMNIPYNSVIDLRDGNQPHTVTMWFKLNILSTVKGTHQSMLSQKDGSGAGRGWIMVPMSGGGAYVANEIIVVRYGANGVGSNVIAEVNKWYFAVLRYSGTTITAFVDGVEGDSVTATIDENANGDFVLATGKTLTGNLNGAIDEVRFYNRALSASEITELYNMGR